MIIRVRLPQALAEFAQGHTEIAVTVVEPASLDDLLSVVALDYPALGRRIVDETGALRRHVNVYVNNEECRRLDGLETRVTADAIIHIVGSIAGG